MDAQGDFLNSTLGNGTFGNKSPCINISNQILTKGFYSAVISFLEDANTLILANPNTPSMTMSQRLQYMNSHFFLKDSLLINYFD